MDNHGTERRTMTRRSALHGAALALVSVPLVVRWCAGATRVYAASVPVPTGDDVLRPLRPGHPRLLWLPEDEARARAAIAADPVAAGYYAAVVAEGRSLLAQPPAERVLIGPRLLEVSRKVLERVYTLALLHRLDGDRQWAARAAAELRAAAAFLDWNPSHFLDVAELSHAFAIGYDWLYDALSSDDRALVRVALVEKGLRPAAAQYRTDAFWVRATHNWNNVCNGGVIAGCLAVADEEPEIARSLLPQALRSLPRALASYGPDGAWIEGPAYWGYATKYTVLALGTLQSALGTDYGFGGMPGLAETGRFRLHNVGPTKLAFNYADAGDRTGDEPSLFWLGRRYGEPLLAYGARATAGKGSPRDVMWYDAAGSRDELAAAALDARYIAAHVACFRSSWTEANALYLAFKGGDNAANHAHLDLGTFVLDAGGQRWAVDLGSDNYDLPGYFGKERYTYYRLRTEGHNTLTLDGNNQGQRAVAPLVAFATGAGGGLAVADLTAAYAAQGATRVYRGVALRDGRSRVVVQDEIAVQNPVSVAWAMQTRASVTVTGDRATLAQGGATLTARLLAPTGATFSVEEVVPPPPQTPAPGVRRLMVRLPERVTDARIVVLFVPGADAGDSPDLVPLDGWEAARSGL